MSARAGERAALKVIGMALDSGAFFNIALEEALSQGSYTEADRAAASAIARSVIENVTALDYALAQVTDLSRCKKPIRNILRIGASRLLYTDMQPAKAVSSAVDLCRGVGKGSQAGYVNAVLRALAKQEVAWPDYSTEPARHLAVKYSWPEWYCREMIAAFGQDFAHDYLSYTRHQPVTLRANPRRACREELLAELGGEPSRLDDAGIVAAISNAAAHPAYKAGRFSIQGEGSMLAARQVLHRLPEHALVLDLCAAPGGKSAYIAERTDSRVIACDIHPHRVGLIEAQAKRLGLQNIEARQQDARQPMEEFIGRADCVLVDAPCTGLGTALSRPDVKLNKTLEDAQALAALQSEILEAAGKMLRPGGGLVYCTCTPTPMETEQVVNAFLGNNPDFALGVLDLPDGLEGREAGTRPGELRLWPHLQGTDAFYICRLERLE